MNRYINKSSFWKDYTILSIIFFSFIIRAAYFLLYGENLSISGDERFYLANAIEISNHIKVFFGASNHTLPPLDLVERGWFLPGMSFVLVPFLVLSEGFNHMQSVLHLGMLADLRLYMGLLNFFFLVIIIYQVYVLFGRFSAIFMVCIASIFPVYIAFSFTFWGETLGAHLMVLYLLYSFKIYRNSLDGGEIGVWKVILLGLLMVCILYVRPSFIFLLPVTLLILVFIYINKEFSILSLTRAVGWFVVFLTIVIIGLAPWSSAVSKKHGGFYATTTTTDMVWPYVYAKGELRERIFSPNREKIRNKWNRMYYNYWETADKTNQSFSQIAKMYKEESLSQVTFADYRRQTLGAINGFYFHENQFLNRFLQRSVYDDTPNSKVKVQLFTYFKMLNTFLWYGLLMVSIAVLCIPWGGSRSESWWLAVFFRLGFASIAIQPFLVGASGRYYEALVILCLSSIAILAQILRNILLKQVNVRDFFVSVDGKMIYVLQWSLPLIIILPLLFLFFWG